jgi:hypothetical protein
MRRACMTTTINIYGRLLLNELTDSATNIGPMFGTEANLKALPKTGTDNRTIPFARHRAQRARSRRRAHCIEKNSSPGGIRTPDQGIMSPLL